MITYTKRFFLILVVMYGLGCEVVCAQKYQVKLISNEYKELYNYHKAIVDYLGVVWMISPEFKLYYYDDTGRHLFKRKFFFDNESISDIIEDKSHRLWITTEKGLFILDEHRSHLIPLSTLGIPVTLGQQGHIRLSKLGLDQIAIAVNNELYYYNCKSTALSKIELPTAKSIFSPALYYSGKEKKLWYLSEQLFTIDTSGHISNIPFKSINYYMLSFIASDQFNEKLSVQLGPKLLRQYALYWKNYNRDIHFVNKFELDENQAKAWSYLKSMPLYETHMYLIYAASIDKSSWVFSTNRGVFWVKAKENNGFKSIKAIEHKELRYIGKDDNEHLIISSYYHLYSYNLATEHLDSTVFFTLFDKYQYAPNSYWACWENYETNSFLHQVDTKNRIQLVEKPSLAPKCYEALQLQETSKGLWTLDQESGYLYCLNPRNGAVLEKLNLNPHPKACHALILANDSTMWIGSDNGLYHVAGVSKGEKLKQLNDVSSVFNNIKINVLYCDKRGCIWAGTNLNGIIMFPSYYPHAIFQYTTDNMAIGANTIFSLEASHSDSVLWLGTQSGLTRFDIFRNSSITLHKKDGLNNEEFNTNSSFKDSDGTIYMGGLNGLTYFDSKIRLDTQPQTLYYISATTVNSQTNQSQYYSASLLDTIVLSPQERYLEIQFHSNDLDDSKGIGFRFKLDELYADWQYPSSERKATFTNLSIGIHVLSIQIRSNTTIWRDIKPLYIYVAPPWYKTWLAYSCFIGLIMGALYGLYRYRVNLILKEYEIRQRVSNDLHDDLGSRIYALRLIAQKIINPSTPEKQKQTNQEDFEQLAQETLRIIRGFIWAFDPEKDKVEDFVERLEVFAETTISPLVKDLVFQEGTISKGKRIAPTIKHNTSLAYQELLINMVKHTDSKHIAISVYTDANNIHIEIENHYTTLKSVPTQGYGMDSLKLRLKEINAQLLWTDTGILQNAHLIIPQTL